MAGVTPPETPQQWVWLARIRRPQGRKGEVFAELLTDFPEKFAERRRLWLVDEDVAEESTHPKQTSPRPGSPLPREVQLQAHWLHKGGVVLHFSDVESISDAEMLTGLVVALPRGDRVALPEDEVYIADLVGCMLVNVAHADTPEVVGTIENVERGVGPVPLLMVRSAAAEVLIPFAKSYLRKLDLDAKRLEMALPEGLANLNLPEPS